MRPGFVNVNKCQVDKQNIVCVDPIYRTWLSFTNQLVHFEYTVTNHIFYGSDDSVNIIIQEYYFSGKEG